MLLLTLVLIANVALAACGGAPTDVRTLSAAAPQAQIAMASLDTAGFASAVANARSAISCLVQPLSPFDAASFHGLEALAAFTDEKPEVALAALAAAVSAMPDYRLPAMIAPQGGELDALLARAKSLAPSAMQPLPPYDGVLIVDGIRALARPTERPCILQLASGDGRVRETYYLRGTDALPKWAPPPTVLQRFLPEPRSKPSVPFAIAAGSTAIAAGGLYALGGAYHARFVSTSTPYDDLPGLKTRTNVSLGGAIGIGFASAAFTTITFLKW